ncbi:GNAT family N-acetyltransferase [Levilactobacillus suantsaii]
MLQAILKTAKQQGATVVHLDVVKGNVPADKLYEKNGFKLVADMPLDYPDLGVTPAKLYECQL